MKFLAVTACLLVAVSAKNIVRIADVRDCGPAEPVYTFSGAVMTDPVTVPGNMSVEVYTTGINIFAKFKFSGVEESKTKLTIRKTTTRLDDNYEVPCLDGFHGSCTLNFCQAISQHPGAFCPLLPPDVACECPLPAGTYAKYDAVVQFDELWLSLDGGVDGNYTTRMEFVDSGATWGCIETDYTLVAAA